MYTCTFNKYYIISIETKAHVYSQGHTCFNLRFEGIALKPHTLYTLYSTFDNLIFNYIKCYRNTLTYNNHRMHDDVIFSEKYIRYEEELHFAISCYLFIKKACIISVY